MESIRNLLFGAIVVIATPVLAARWEPIAGGNGVEIDKARIARAAQGWTTAWSRIVLGKEMVDEQGQRYTALEVLHRYDCDKRTAATLKRVYLRDGKKVREEAVAEARELPAETGSVDDRLLTEACRLRTVGEGRQVAETAARQATEASRPGPMYADMRSEATARKPGAMQVADPKAEAKPESKPVAKAESKGEAKTESRPESKSDGMAEAKADAKPAESAGPKRFIELPKIDKSQVEHPRDEKAAENPKDGAKSAARAAEAAKPAEKADRQKPVGLRQELERQYATSGPRRSATRKAPSEAPGDAVARHAEIHWDYEGPGGPANWGGLRPDFAVCATGKRQSPIDIREGIRVDLEPIRFDYRPTQFRVSDNGHTIQVTVGEGSSITVLGKEYALVQFHFHRPAEERVNGKAFDMVAHLVHQDYDGNLAVIAVLMEKGSEHPLIQTVWNYMPLEKGLDVAPPGVALDLNRLLPESRAYYTYMGSLTTPPCSENVLWMVFKQPVQVSSDQISVFSRLYRNNARPIQPAQGRLVKESR